MTFEFFNIKWGLSDKTDGNMHLKLPNLNYQNIKNRETFFRKLGIDINNTTAANLVHGNKITIITNDHKGQIIQDTDGLITDQNNIFLTVTVADCMPVYFFDPDKNIIGIAHAGWRGVVKKLSQSMIEKMIAEFNSNPKNIFAHIGPHIQKCHFEIKNDITEKFDCKFVIHESNTIKVDLSSIIKSQLLSQGLNINNISSSKKCTYCEEKKFFSYRREKSEKVEAMVAFIGITS